MMKLSIIKIFSTIKKHTLAISIFISIFQKTTITRCCADIFTHTIGIITITRFTRGTCCRCIVSFLALYSIFAQAMSTSRVAITKGAINTNSDIIDTIKSTACACYKWAKKLFACVYEIFFFNNWKIPTYATEIHGRILVIYIIISIRTLETIVTLISRSTFTNSFITYWLAISLVGSNIITSTI